MGTLSSLTSIDTSSFLWKSEFRTCIEDHLDWLRSHSENKAVVPTDNLGVKNFGDFYGLLIDLDVPSKYHWVTMRMNDYESPFDYNGNYNSVIIPNFRVIENLLNKFSVNRKKESP